MTLDGFLTFLALVVAIYALIPEVTRLRIKFGFCIQILVAISAFLLVLYFEFFSVLGRPCLTAIEPICERIVFTDNSSFTPPQAAFVTVLFWLAAALTIYKFSSWPRASSSLPIMSQIIDNLIYEQRFAEAIKLIEPYIPIINKAVNRKLPLQRLHDYFAAMKGVQTTKNVTLRLENGDDVDLDSDFWRWVGELSRLIPAPFKAQYAADDIASALFQTDTFRDYIVKNKPYFAVPLFQLDTQFERNKFFDAYFGELITHNNSILYKEVQHFAENGYISENNRLLSFLFDDARNALELKVWKPIGDKLLDFLKQDTSSNFILDLNKSENKISSEHRPHPVDTGILFFDLMITSAAKQGIQYHMWLFYLVLIVEKLEQTYDTSDISVNTSDEFPTHCTKLIYDVLEILCGWVRLASELPDESPHRQFSQFPSISDVERQLWDYDSEISVNIPLSAARAIGSVMYSIMTSDRIGGKFKAYLYWTVLDTIKRIRNTGEDGRLRKFMINTILFRGVGEKNVPYGQQLIKYFNEIDHDLQRSVDDYKSALFAVYNNSEAT